MTSERVRRAAAKAAVTASEKTGRPVHPEVARLAACPNCDDRKCMGCVCRDPGHDCYAAASDTRRTDCGDTSTYLCVVATDV